MYLYEKYTKIKNLILSYESVLEVLDGIISDSKVDIQDKTSFKTAYGYPINHYVVGNGSKDIFVVGTTHGNEIITTDFVLNLFYKLTQDNEYSGLLDEYNFHIIPVLNPEGYIITTTAIASVIDETMPLNKMRDYAYNYYKRFREDDIYSRENPKDLRIKNHQKFIDINNIDDSKHKLLINNAKKMILETGSPMGSLISWRANGRGVDLNNNTFNKKDARLRKKIIYGGLRYNNLTRSKPGPLGVDHLNGEYELENLYLLRVLKESLNDESIFLYHSTGGTVFYRPYLNEKKLGLSREELLKKSKENLLLAKEYVKKAQYPINYQHPLVNMDDYLRLLYPKVLLIELSKMGGNPLGPYGDLENYKRVINDNLDAFFSTMIYSKELKK